jgi:hypothetical protein
VKAAGRIKNSKSPPLAAVNAELVKVRRSDDPMSPERSNALWKPIQAVIELATGIGASEPKDWFLSAGHVLQRVRGGRFTATLVNEINDFRAKGRIKDDYFESDQGQACLQELLNALDTDSPDEIRFNAMKSVLLAIASENLSSRNDVVPLQVMQICRQLSSGEVLVLSATDALHNSGNWRAEAMNRGQLIPLLVRQTGLGYAELIELSAEKLEAKKLVSLVGSKGGPDFGFKLTGLGERICRFIEAYGGG